LKDKKLFTLAYKANISEKTPTISNEFTDWPISHPNIYMLAMLPQDKHGLKSH
jgi:hypothetical protein